MAKLVLWLRLLAGAWLLSASASASAQERDPAGRWALRAEGRVLALLDLRRDPAGSATWTGAWTRPERVTINDAHLAFDISGPAVIRPIQRVTVRGETLELTVPGRSAEQEPTVFTFRVVAPDAAEMGWRGEPMPPVRLQRVPADTIVATGWDPARRYVLDEPSRRSHPEMAAIFEADQAPRRGLGPIDWSIVEPQDRARRERTLQLLNAGALQSGDDYWHAAFVLQHGREPNDHLLAHTLAVIAVARGRPDATWIAAATLDRYLQGIGQKQIYGTQYQTPPGQATTQEPYDRTLIPDALRQALRVPTLAQQEQQRGEFETRARERERATPR